jgi:hypothetical protein
MANAKRCDRCGRFYDFYEGIEFTAGANKYIYVILASPANERRFDMCPDCMRQVIRFLHNESNTHSLKCNDCKHLDDADVRSTCTSCKRMKPECDHDRFEYNEKKVSE